MRYSGGMAITFWRNGHRYTMHNGDVLVNESGYGAGWCAVRCKQDPTGEYRFHAMWRVIGDQPQAWHETVASWLDASEAMDAADEALRNETGF